MYPSSRFRILKNVHDKTDSCPISRSSFAAKLGLRIYLCRADKHRRKSDDSTKRFIAIHKQQALKREEASQQRICRSLSVRSLARATRRYRSAAITPGRKLFSPAFADFPPERRSIPANMIHKIIAMRRRRKMNHGVDASARYFRERVVLVIRELRDESTSTSTRGSVRR